MNERIIANIGPNLLSRDLGVGDTCDMLSKAFQRRTVKIYDR